jgi:chromosome segregation ATPase
MDEDTRAAFARIDRWFDLGQQQHLELREQHLELRQHHTELRQLLIESRSEMDRRFTALDRRFTALEQQLRSLRDWVSAAIADLRSAIQQILVRLDRLERRQDDPFG